jgi:hypothetical protein
MDLRKIAARPNLEQYRHQAKDLLRRLRADDVEAWARLKVSHPRAHDRDADRSAALSDAQLVLAREHGFDSWPKFARQIEQLARSSGPDFMFESAVDAVVAGDVQTLMGLLGSDPGLARATSARIHRATLLHYVAANGVEDFRQRCPANATEVAGELIDAGADVNATANLYGRDSSVLDMLVSSAHPAAAGVQGALAELLLDRGAKPGAALMVALAFGYPETAAVIARRAEIDNVVAAAGLGRLDLVSTFVDPRGTLSASSRLTPIPGMPNLPVTPKTQLEQALNWAALSNRPAVVDFLLDRGVDPNAAGTQGFTAAHWAAFHGHVGVLRILLGRKAPLESRNVYGGTVLGTAVWACVNRSDAAGIDYALVVRELLEHGARVDAAAFPCGHVGVDELLSKHGAREARSTMPERPSDDGGGA